MCVLNNLLDTFNYFQMVHLSADSVINTPTYKELMNKLNSPNTTHLLINNGNPVIPAVESVYKLVHSSVCKGLINAIQTYPSPPIYRPITVPSPSSA